MWQVKADADMRRTTTPSVFLRQHNRRLAAVGLGDDTDFFAATECVSGEHPEAVFYSVLISFPVMVIYLAPVSVRMTGQEGIEVVVQGSPESNDSPKRAENFAQWECHDSFAAFRVALGPLYARTVSIHWATANKCCFGLPRLSPRFLRRC